MNVNPIIGILVVLAEMAAVGVLLLVLDFALFQFG